MTWDEGQVERWIKSSLLRGMGGLGDIERSLLLALETNRTMLQLQLTIHAWRVEHGSLPESLDQLIGHGIDSVPWAASDRIERRSLNDPGKAGPWLG